jgi:hypothetical protein
MNVYRRLIAAIIVFSLCPYGGFVRSARAAPRVALGRPTALIRVVSPTTPDEARRAIERLGVGHYATIVRSGEMLQGRIADITADDFVLVRDSGGEAVAIGYAEVQEVGTKAGTTKKVLIVAGLAALAVMIAIAVHEYRGLKK